MPAAERVLEPLRRVALVTHSFNTGGGVPTVARWLRVALESSGGYLVDVHDLATDSRDASSRRLVAPRSWARASLLDHPPGSSVFHWGANAVEVEPMRYRSRRELGKTLETYDLIQVVAGIPAWASAVTGLHVPVALQVATLASWERPSQLAGQAWPSRTWRTAMTGLTSRVERSALRNVGTVLVENTAMAQHVRSIGQDSVVMAPPGVDTCRFCPSPSGWKRDGYLLSVCRLNEPRKGLERMIRAVAEMLRISSSTPVLVLAGRGQILPSIARLIAELDLSEKVVIESGVTPADLADLYRGASVYLQTSHEEGLGMSALEAMSCGLPVVATATSGACEFVVNGETGWLVPQTPPEEVPRRMADCALSLIEGDGSAVGARCRDLIVSRFSTAVALERFIRVHDGLLGVSHRAAPVGRVAAT